MSIDRLIDAVIFDLGGVLCSNGRPSDLLRRFPNDPPDKVLDTVMGGQGLDTDHPWHRLERGEISLADYSTALSALIAAAGLTPASDPPETDSASRAVFTFEPSTPMLDLVHDLRSQRVVPRIKLGVLTNNVREFKEGWRAMVDFDLLFDDVVDSHELGIRKPNAEIYRVALERLGADPARTAFLDDSPANVEAATALGMHGIVVDVDPTAAIARVRDLTRV